MNVLVTGGNGFLGRNLIRILSKNKDLNIVSFSSSDVDLKLHNSLHKFNNLNFDKIYHLAAWTQAGDFSLTHMGEQWVNNQLINSNVLTWWKDYQPQSKFMSIGTSCSYEEGSDLKEENYLNGSPLRDLYAYGMTKRMLYIGLKSLNQQFGFKYLVTIPSTLYGPGYEISNRIPHFIFDIIKKIIKAKKYNDQVELWGNGYQKRELVYVDDYVHQMLLLEDKLENDICNIGAGIEYSIREFAKIICEIVDYNFDKILFNENKYTGAKSKKLNTKKINNILGNYKTITLEEGLRKTVADIINKI